MFIKSDSLTLTAKSTSPAMLLWMEMMNFLFWRLIKHLVLVGVLGVEFSAALNPQLTGLYKCAYLDGGEKKNTPVSQFEAVDARRCFPCWDEPALKATFKIALDVPSELTALSNMPIINEKFDGYVKTVYFEESPIMSTYLVAVVVGLFDHIEDTTADGKGSCVLP